MRESTVIFLGGLFLEQLEKSIIKNSKSNIHAANIFQWNLVEGIKRNIQNEVNIVSAPYVGFFPKYYQKLYVPGCTERYNENYMSVSVGFINIFGIKEIFRQKGAYKAIQKIIRNSKNENVVILVYAMNTALIKAAIKAKHNNEKKVHICLVCPDLPQYMNVGMSRGKLFDILKKIDLKTQQKQLAEIDSFVFLTKYMNDIINTNHKPWCVIEGIVTEKKEEGAPGVKNKTILYAGGICEEYGVYNLIDSFVDAPHDGWKLVLCGFVDERTKEQYKGKDIEFMGMVPNEMVKQLEKEATLLVNPRPNKGEFVRFSFPSKTLEYMLSGTPVLMYGLEGMPQEYYDYIYTVETFDGDLKSALTNLMSLEAELLEEKGKKAKEFVLKEKNAKRQCKKIVDMIKGSNDE